MSVELMEICTSGTSVGTILRLPFGLHGRELGAVACPPLEIEVVVPVEWPSEPLPHVYRWLCTSLHANTSVACRGSLLIGEQVLDGHDHQRGYAGVFQGGFYAKLTMHIGWYQAVQLRCLCRCGLAYKASRCSELRRFGLLCSVIAHPLQFTANREYFIACGLVAPC